MVAAVIRVAFGAVESCSASIATGRSVTLCAVIQTGDHDLFTVAGGCTGNWLLLCGRQKLWLVVLFEGKGGGMT